MKKKICKFISAFCAVTMVISFSACGKNEVKESVSATESNISSEVVKESETVSTSEEEVVTYPMETDIKLRMWCGNQMALSDEYASWEQSPFHVGLQEKTGIEMDWIYLTKGADVGQAYNLLWLDQDIPEIIYYGVNPTTGTELVDDDAIWDLTEYLPKYAPNYWELINRPEYETELKSVTTNDGKHFCIPALREGNYNLTWIGPVIRQDWLEECGLKSPVTLEDWEDVLVAFKEKYNATLSFEMGAMSNSGGIASGTGALGFANQAAFRVVDNTIVESHATPEFYDMMEILVDWWEKGLIDHDCLTINGEGLRAKALSGDVGIVFTAMSGFTNIVKDAENEKNGANWVGLSYPRTEPGAPTSMICTSGSLLSGYGAMISKTATEEELIAALQWLDYGWTEEGVMYWNFGEEGTSYYFDENGKPQWMDVIANDPMGLDYAVRKYTGAWGSAPVVQLSDFVASKNASVVAEAVEVWSENTVARSYLMPSLKLSEEDTQRYYDLWVPVNTYLNEECVKMMSCKTPLSEYDSVIKTANEMGLTELLEMWQKYYDEYAK